MQCGRGMVKVVCGAPGWVVAGRALHWPANKVRSTFLQYFESQDHHVMPSSPVIPWNDRTLTYVNAGMNQVGSWQIIQLDSISLMLQYSLRI